ncbi:phosphatase PAP2 family protein [Streptomyces sp. KL116D]|uniref:phosphatase PAP2 family protein n=1 Tax=Streptomyces sp. KL116D TaxID=3045152 RepID=UPI003556315D
MSCPSLADRDRGAGASTRPPLPFRRAVPSSRATARCASRSGGPVRPCRHCAPLVPGCRRHLARLDGRSAPWSQPRADRGLGLVRPRLRKPDTPAYCCWSSGCRQTPQGLFVYLALVATHVAVQIFKHVVDRPRPDHPLVSVDHGSLPSGHAALMAMSAVVIGVVFVPRHPWSAWWPVGVAMTLAMMWSRTWVHAHWLSDTTAGAMVGCGATLLVWCAFASRCGVSGRADAATRAVGYRADCRPDGLLCRELRRAGP